MYQNYLQGYQPYNFYQQQPQQPMLPPQQVLQANGRTSISSLKMSPNSSALIMDTTAPIVWLCTSDSLGNVTPTAYDISPHKDVAESQASDFETRLSAVERSIIEMRGGMNDVKPNAGSSKSKQAGRSAQHR